MGNLIAPHQCLTIALFQSGKGPTGPKRFAHIANGPLHPAFLIASAYLAGARREVIVGAQLHQSRVEVDLIATPLQYGAAQIVVENDPRLARPGLKGMDVASQEVLHGLIEEELQIQRPRVGQG